MKTLLIVDDDKSLCDVLWEEAKSAGLAADHVYSELDAIKQLEQEDYEVVVTDMRMISRKSGLEVLKAAKARSPDTQVIVLTAYSDVEGAVESMQSGAFTYSIKQPEGKKEGDGLLIHQIRRALEHHDALRQHRVLEEQQQRKREEVRFLEEKAALQKRLLSGLDQLASKMHELQEMIELLRRLKDEVATNRRPRSRSPSKKGGTPQ
jgi:DNA-binding NtrC family response regulator